MSTNRVRSLAATVFIAASLLVPAAASADTAHEEARRQLDLAASELTAGNLDSSLQASQSAFRLDPTLVEALLLQGLAHKARGDVEAGRALAMAYLGSVGWRDTDPRANELLSPYTDDMPVHVEVLRERRKVVVRFAVRSDVLDPVLHWRTANGEWRSIWMTQDEGGDWVHSVRPGPGQSSITWWLEPTVGRPVIDRDGDGGQAPFLLALK